MKTILVTGASGFLGQAVIRKLVQTGAYNVIAVTSGRKKTVFPDGVIEEAVDLLDEKARAGIIDRTQPQILMHLAWAQEHNFRESLNNIRWLEASTSLLRHFAANNGECFFFAGTSDEYSDDNGKAHDIAYNQRMSMYGECKKAFATIMDNYCSHIGMRFIDGRFFTIYGKGDPHFFGAIPQTILSLLRNEPVVCKAPNTIRDYIHIDDAASAAIQLVGSDYSGSVNIASGRPIMMRDVFRRIATVLGKEHLLSFENEAICEQILVADCATLNGVIDTASFHSFETALPEMIAWWIDEDIAQSESDHVVVQITSDVVSKIAGGGENKNSVLVTGASGFLGKAITSKLADKPQFTVYAVTSGRRSVSFPATVKTVAANLLDREACRKLIQETQPSIMCHLAWGLVDSKFLISPDNICWLETGLQLLSLFKEHGGRRFVFAGSSAEYGYENSICKEDEQGNPSDLYGVCKAAFTAVAAKFCADNGMEFVSARIFSVYGAGETHLLHAVPVAIDALMRGNVFVCKSPNNIWDYIYIDDAAAATVMLLESDFCGIINIASGVGSTMREVFTTIAEQLGKESLLSFENEDLPGLMLVADTAVLNEIIGFSCNYDLHEGLKQTIGWRQKQQ